MALNLGHDNDLYIGHLLEYTVDLLRLFVRPTFLSCVMEIPSNSKKVGYVQVPSYALIQYSEGFAHFEIFLVNFD